jgi:S1-C subfamily serine protease
LAETSTNDVASGVAVDWRQPWEGRTGYSEATPVSSTTTEAQSKGVVLINTVLPYDNASGAGTGMVLTASGQVLTSYHVVEGASTIKVTVAATGKTYRATVVGSDQTADVALLQLQGASGLATIKIDNDATSVGDKVTAVGNAGGTGTLTAAKGTIVSLKASITTAAEGPVASETLTGMIETTADVVSGDSGGRCTTPRVRRSASTPPLPAAPRSTATPLRSSALSASFNRSSPGRRAAQCRLDPRRSWASN